MSGCSSMAAEIAAVPSSASPTTSKPCCVEKRREGVARQRMIVHDEDAICHVPLIGRRRAADK